MFYLAWAIVILAVILGAWVYDGQGTLKSFLVILFAAGILTSIGWAIRFLAIYYSLQ